MRRSSARLDARSSAPLTLAACGALLACSPEFEPQSKLSALRVLAVQKSAPYARPGETVSLRMLLADGSDAAPRPVQVTWFAGCKNPPGDIYAGCFQGLAQGDALAGFSTGTGLEFSLKVPDDVLEGRARPADSRAIPYGLLYVFFAACAGELRPLPFEGKAELPLGCFSASGERLGPSDFVAGYTAVYAYSKLRNGNPAPLSFTVDGQAAEAECVDEACVELTRREIGAPAGPDDVGGSDGGAAADAGPAPPPPLPTEDDPCHPEGPRCLRTCTDVGDCPEHDLDVVVDATSVERDENAEARGTGTVLEQMWINYYADDGKLGTDVKLLNDATRGLNPEHATTLKAPSEPGPFHVYAVVHDNRGGVGWARLRLLAR